MREKLIGSIKSGMIGDFVYKLMANVLTTVFRNLLVLPVLASIFSLTEYGNLITAIGVITTIAAGLGNSLLSTRLVMDADYRKENIEGDFNSICIGVSFVSVPFVILIHFMFPNFDFFQLVLVGVILFAETFVGYHSGWFILRQEYRRLLVYTVIGGAGYIVGLLLAKVTGYWSFAYLICDMVSMSFLIKYSPLVKEMYGFTKKRKKMLGKYMILIITTIIANAISYLDRLFLYPVIGSDAVSVYTTASIFGKVFSLISLPVSSILLGYYAAERLKLDVKKYWTVNIATLSVLAIFIILTQIFGIWFTGLLYPSIIEQAKPYIMIANISSAIAASAQITRSAALKYAKIYWVMIIQVIYASTYLGFGYLGLMSDGLRGFSYAVLAANIIQILVLYIVCHISLSKTQENKLTR